MEFIYRLIICILSGFLIGYERQQDHKIIGVRSVLLLMLGSFVFTHVSISIGGDPARVAAQIVSGIGFLGAGIIFKEKATDIKNLTTAILIWVLAALACLIAIGLIKEAFAITIIIYIILQSNFIKDI